MVHKIFLLIRDMQILQNFLCERTRIKGIHLSLRTFAGQTGKDVLAAYEELEAFSR